MTTGPAVVVVKVVVVATASASIQYDIYLVPFISTCGGNSVQPGTKHVANVLGGFKLLAESKRLLS